MEIQFKPVYIHQPGKLASRLCDFIEQCDERDEVSTGRFLRELAKQLVDAEINVVTLVHRCANCDSAIEQSQRGRPRKYCSACVEQLRHRTPATQARKSRAEKATG